MSGAQVVRVYQGVLIVSTLLNSWLGMQLVHESGHIFAACLTGGRVTKVVLHPLAISRTDVDPNPQALLVVWAGPLAGVLLPLVFWSVAVRWKWRGAFLLRFFAGFCLIANGAYIGIGSIERIGDCGEMLRHGAASWQLWLFGLLTVPAGFALWNRQGVHFGLGNSGEKIDPLLAKLSLTCLLTLATLEYILFPT